MIIKLRGDIAKAIGGKKELARWVNVDSWSFKNMMTSDDAKKTSFDLDLARWPTKKVEAWRDHLAKYLSVNAVKPLHRDTETWLKAIASAETAGSTKAGTLQKFVPLARRYIGASERKWIYERTQSGEWMPYYVAAITYHAPSSRGSDTPAYVSIDLIHEEFGGIEKNAVVLYDHEVRGKTVSEILANDGYYKESDERDEVYEAEHARYSEIVEGVGKQYWARGTATDDMDGNPHGRSGSWYWKRTNAVDLDPFGEPSRVVIDVFHEDPEDRKSPPHYSHYFWHDRIESDDDADVDEVEVFNEADIRIPVHPWLAIYHFGKHLRLKTHVNTVTPYEYDRSMADRLVLDSDRKGLVKLLLAAKDGFKDIVRGKSGGIVVLLAGPPGTGKTLTAEVYAESEQRPLYSVQCSQLGTTADALEDELLKVFSRARRWNAVILLDEADVYVHSRGNDMKQNAIVGVFLRVLEYQSTILFLTTNRPDDVDDAIASRAVARLSYDTPSIEDQKRIWETLAAVSGTTIAPKELEGILIENPRLSGRDIKNLIKLARLVSDDKKTVTVDAVQYVRQFQPTTSQGRAGLKWAFAERTSSENIQSLQVSRARRPAGGVRADKQ